MSSGFQKRKMKNKETSPSRCDNKINEEYPEVTKRTRPLPSRGADKKNEKFEVRVPDKTGLRGQCGNWTYGPGETRLMGPGKTGLMGPVWKLSLGASELGLGARRAGLTGPVWKLGLGASVDTGLSGPINWAKGPVWKLGLWASAETGLRSQCRNWALGPVWKLGLGASVETVLRGQCENCALGPARRAGLRGQAKLGWA
ncbi:hypothetical protein V8G54_035417 [Vigna mungo]|uniref:Uncharacterized protein n=1 Tax=Vigna mungo TaxID=3915 RepID=A0AAQ3MFT5_VIGMU